MTRPNVQTVLLMLAIFAGFGATVNQLYPDALNLLQGNASGDVNMYGNYLICDATDPNIDTLFLCNVDDRVLLQVNDSGGTDYTWTDGYFTIEAGASINTDLFADVSGNGICWESSTCLDMGTAAGDGKMIIQNNAGTAGDCIDVSSDNLFQIYDDDCTTLETAYASVFRVESAGAFQFGNDRGLLAASADGNLVIRDNGGDGVCMDVTTDGQVTLGDDDNCAAAANLVVLGKTDAGAGLEIGNGATLPGTCVAGEIFQDTDSDDCADTGGGDGALCLCKTTNTWVLLNNI